MTAMVLETKTLPEELSKLVSADKVRVVQEGDEIRITPFKGYAPEWPLCGMLADGRLSSEEFMADKQAEKELENRCFE